MHPFIVKGDYAEITNVPHSVHLGVDCKSDIPMIAGDWICGASIVTQEAGLTAGHCLYGCNSKSKITISAGNVKPTAGVVTVAYKFTVHSNYQNLDISAGYDIALVRFKRPLQLSPQIKRVALMENLPLPKEALVAGWGLIGESPEVSSELLKEAKQFMLTKKQCIRILKQIPVGTICARNRMGYASLGDSGSGLIAKGYIQIGLVSYKVWSEDTKDVIVYTDVRYYYKWIQTQLNTVMC